MIYLKTAVLASLYIVLTTSVSKLQCGSAKPATPTVNSISKISYSSTGGRSGNSENLDITADSLIYIQGHRGSEKSIKEKTEKSFWDELTRAINLKDFDQIKSSPGRALYDGIDVSISIEKGNEIHSIVNGEEDSTNFKKITPFTNLLETRLIERRKKITW